MKHSVNGNTASNIYTFNADSVLADYPAFIEGDANALVCVVSTGAISDKARSALEASCEKLNFGCDRIAWIRLEPGLLDSAAEASDVPISDMPASNVSASNLSDSNSSTSDLSATDLHQIIESLDPVALIAADVNSASALGIAYGTALDIDAFNRVLCRSIIAFNDFEAMLGDSEKKQRAWYLLKYLK